MRQITTIFLLTILCFGFVMPTFAQERTSSDVSTFILNGSLFTPPSDEPVPFIDENNRTLVPLRFFSTYLGINDIRWHNETKEAVLLQEGHELRIREGERAFWRNGNRMLIDTAPIIKEGRIFLPLRALAESIDAKVHWYPADRTIHMNTRDKTLRLSPDEAKKTIGIRGDKVVQFLADLNMESLANLIHPVKGVRFTPQTYMHNDDVTLMPEDVRRLAERDTLYNWGTTAGKGDSITLTFAEFYDQYLFSHDYRKADLIRYNDNVLAQQGGAAHYWQEYPNAAINEYHFKGFEEQYGGIDWRSLIIVFEEHEDEWYVVALVNGEWTP